METGRLGGSGVSSTERRRRERGEADERKRMRTMTAPWLYSAAKEHGDDTQQPPHASAKQEVALADAHGSQWKLAGGESCLLALFK